MNATTLTASSGTISDGPGDYAPNLRCSWLIQAGSAVSLSFSAFRTEAGYDFVDVYDGGTVGSPLLGHFSGASPPPAVRSTTGSMLVTFGAGGSVESSGFVAMFSGIFVGRA